MKSKMLIAGGLVLAFVLGTMANGFHTSTSNAFVPAQENGLTAARPVRATPAVARTRYVQPAYIDAPVERVVVQQPRKRSWEKEVLIVGSSAGAGAAIGAIAGGKKGAGIGALSGGIAGLVYDLATRNKR